MGKVGQSNRIEKRAQKGVGALGAIVIISIIAVVAMFGMSAAPMYFNHFTVMEIVNGISNDPALRDQTTRQVKSAVTKQFQTNNLWDMDPEEVVKVRRDKTLGLIIDVDYEVRRPLFYNMELIAHFSEEKVGIN